LLFDRYRAIKEGDPSSAPNIIRMGIAIMDAQGRQGRYDLAPLAPMASAAMGSGMVAGVAPRPSTGGTGAAKGPIWSSTKTLSSVENAFGHWKKHKAEFPEFANVKQYVEGAHAFTSNPPIGTLAKTSGGRTVMYHEASNTFAVRGADGAPRTMFRPDPAKHGYKTNLEYFHAQ